jgi:RNA polymerase sigma-70 factor (ECF subfamily)
VEAIQMSSVVTADAVESSSVDPRDETLRLFETHGTSLFRFCRFTLGRADEAEDVVQDTFLKLLQHLEGRRDRTNLRAWLFAVAANACRDRTRWRARWISWRADLDLRAVTPADAPDDVRCADAALRRLAPRDRLLLSLRAQGLSYRDSAAAAQISEGSVGRLLARAVERWKKKLRSHEP